RPVRQREHRCNRRSGCSSRSPGLTAPRLYVEVPRDDNRGSRQVQQETLVLDKPEQLKALGHPLRVRVLEMLGQEGEWQLTDRELAQRLSVDPGHLHFHVRMLLKAGLIELADDGAGREKPYRAVAQTLRVAPDLLGS